MGLLNYFAEGASAPRRLPSGSFTMDSAGELVASTLPGSYPRELLEETGRFVLAAFRRAEAARLPLTELALNYSALKITAREMRGGAIVFLSPLGPAPAPKQSFKQV